MAYKLYERMAFEAEQDDLEADVSEELRQYSRLVYMLEYQDQIYSMPNMADCLM